MSLSPTRYTGLNPPVNQLPQQQPQQYYQPYSPLQNQQQLNNNTQTLLNGTLTEQQMALPSSAPLQIVHQPLQQQIQPIEVPRVVQETKLEYEPINYRSQENLQNQFDKDTQLMRERRLRDEIKGLEDKVLGQLTLIDTLTLESTKYKTHITRLEAQQDQYKDTLKKMYMKHVEQEKVIESLKSNSNEYVQSYDKINVENVDLNNDIKNILVDREILEARLLEGDKKYNFDIQSLTAQLSDKNVENSEIKRRLNDSLDIKRRLEEEIASLRFALDNARAKMEAEVREKQIKLEQLERAFQENMDVKNQEQAGTQDRIRELELEIRRLMDQNKNYAHELTILSKDIRYKDYETSKLNQTIAQGGIQQQQIRGSGPINANLSLVEQERINSSQNPNNPQYDFVMPQYPNQQQQQIGSHNSTSNQFIPGGSNSQGFQQQQSQLVSNQGNRGRIPQQFQKKPHDQVDQFLNMYEKNTNKKLKYFLLQLWKAKAELKGKGRQNKALVNMKYGAEMGGSSAAQMQQEQQYASIPDDIDMRGGQSGGFQQQQISKQGASSGGFGTGTIVRGGGAGGNQEWTNNLCNGIITILSFTRTAIANVAFEVFGKSIQQANDKKLNALNVFMANMKEIKDKYWKGLILVLETYLKTRKLLKDFLPQLANKPMLASLEQKIVLATGKLQKGHVEIRDNLNKYVETTIAHTIQKKAIDKLDKNRDFIYLFRLLTVKHRIRYPMRGKSFKVDLDLEVALDHKIVAGLQKLIVQE